VQKAKRHRNNLRLGVHLEETSGKRASATFEVMPLLPLEGFRVGITADRRWSEQAELLERRGASVLHAPTSSTDYLACHDTLRAATDDVISRPPDYLVATTGIGLRAWFEGAQAWGMAEQLAVSLQHTRVIARGPKASGAARGAGLEVWASPPSERLDDVVTLLAAEPLQGKRIAFQHYGEHDASAVAALAATGAEVVDVPVYRYRAPADDGHVVALLDAVRDGHIDAVTFTSAPAVRHLIAMARERDRDGELLDAFNHGGVLAACVGPVCAERAHACGITAPVAPERGRMGLLVRTISEVLAVRQRHLQCGPAAITVQGRAVAVDGERVELPARERAVLDVLLRHQGVVVSKPTILRAIDSDPAAVHALETTITRLRRNLGPAGASVRAVRGRGYMLDGAA
jgi:uroporphyrinogen-III synthase